MGANLPWRVREKKVELSLGVLGKETRSFVAMVTKMEQVEVGW